MSSLTFGEKRDIVSKFQSLLRLDEKICSSGQNLVNSVIKSGKGINFTDKKTLERNISFVGSLAEGCTVPRLFGTNYTFWNSLNHEAELDIDYTFIEIPRYMRDCVEEHPSKSGIVRVIGGTREFISLGRNIGWVLSDQDIISHLWHVYKNGYAKPFGMKTILQEKMDIKKADTAVDFLMSASMLALNNVNPDDVSITNTSNDINKAAIGAEYLMKVRERPILQLSIDFATVFRTTWWPDRYNKWKYKERNWPSQSVINRLTTNINIIAKPSDEEKNNKQTTEFRYSFAHIERSLVDMRSKQQKLVYLIFKIFLVKYLKPEAGDGEVTSFLAKNTMFVVCENCPPHDKIWQENYDSMVEALEVLLSRMLTFFENETMPYYFDSDVNLIESMSSFSRERVASKIQSLLTNLDEYLQIPITKEMDAGVEVLRIVEGTFTYFKDKRDWTFSQWWGVIRYPKLRRLARELSR